MQDWLSARAKISPQKTALCFEGESYSYQWLEQQVQWMQARWIAAGIRRGQHIALLMQNQPIALIHFFTALRMGVIFVPLNTRLSLAELHYQIQQVDVDFLLPEGDSATLSALADLGVKIVSLETESPDSPLPYEVDLAAPCVIIHSSGTSGKPKGVVLTYGNFFYSAMASAYRIGHLPDDKWLCVMPLYHVGGLSILVRAVLYGITVDLYEKFDLQAVQHAFTQDVTLASLVPTMLYRLLENRTAAWSPKLRLILLGGAAAHPELLERCLAEGVPIGTTYGLSEAASQVATALGHEIRAKISTVGKPLLFTEVRIVDEQGIDCLAGVYGEILVRGLSVMQGYYQNPEATAQALQDGWLHTGDIGYLDAEGDLFLVQRRSDLIVTGGENVYPAEVEAVLRKHPAIQAVAVVGIPDIEWGQRVAAALVLKEGQHLSPDELQSFCREQLAGYKIPRAIRFVADLPQTASGKIQSSAVRALWA